jgi:hypothetical protein
MSVGVLQCLKYSKYMSGKGWHICYLCDATIDCAAKDNKDCKCETVLAYCQCTRCSAPTTIVKGIVAFVCPDPCIYSDGDDDDFFSFSGRP